MMAVYMLFLTVIITHDCIHEYVCTPYDIRHTCVHTYVCTPLCSDVPDFFFYSCCIFTSDIPLCFRPTFFSIYIKHIHMYVLLIYFIMDRVFKAYRVFNKQVIVFGLGGVIVFYIHLETSTQIPKTRGAHTNDLHEAALLTLRWA